MTEAEAYEALKAEVEAALALDPWGADLSVHDDAGTASPKEPAGWVELVFQVDNSSAEREGMEGKLMGESGRLMVHFYQPTAFPADELRRCAGGVQARLQSKDWLDLYVESCIPGTTAAADGKPGYRHRMATFFVDWCRVLEVIP